MTTGDVQCPVLNLFGISKGENKEGKGNKENKEETKRGNEKCACVCQ
jgi:hypothetical protein